MQRMLPLLRECGQVTSHLLLPLLYTCSLMQATAAARGLELELEYGPAGPMLRDWRVTQRREVQRSGPSRRGVQESPGAPPGRTLDLSIPESRGVSDKLMYFVTLLIGSPPRPFRLHLDTGSSGLYVPASYNNFNQTDSGKLTQ